MAVTYLNPTKKKPTATAALPSIDPNKPLVGFKGFNLGGNSFSNIPNLNSVPNQPVLPKVGTVSGGQVNTLAMGKPDFPISTQTLTKPTVNPAATKVKAPLGSPAPNPLRPPAPSGTDSGFHAVLQSGDPALSGNMAMGNRQMTPRLDQNPHLMGSTTAPEAPTASSGSLTPPAPTNPAQDQLKALQKQYLSTFDQSPEEKAAQAQLDAISGRQAMLRANEQAGEANVAEQPIAFSMIGGQQAALQRQLNARLGQESAQAVPLASKLASYQAQREAQQKRGEAELKFATPEKVTPVEVGGRLVNPQTGEVVYEPPAGEKKTETQTLSPGQILVDAQGNEIARNDSVTDKTTTVAPGSAIVDSQGNVIYQAPSDASSQPLSGEAAKVYAIASTIKPEIEQVKNLLKGAGRLRISQILAGLDPAASRLIDQVADKVGRLRSGGAINKDEAERFKAQILRAGDVLTGDTTSALAALDAISAEADSVAQSVRPEGQSPAPGGGDELDQILDSLGFKTEGGVSNTAQLKTLTIGNRDVRVAPQIALRLAKAAQDFKQATGQDLQIVQDFRSHEEQARLFQELSKKGARVAPPGQSFHESGLAIDVSNWREAEPYLRRYGLVNDLADDKNHFSFGETNRRA